MRPRDGSFPPCTLLSKMTVICLPMCPRDCATYDHHKRIWDRQQEIDAEYAAKDAAKAAEAAAKAEAAKNPPATPQRILDFGLRFWILKNRAGILCPHES